jgi:hypothetical protein
LPAQVPYTKGTKFGPLKGLLKTENGLSQSREGLTNNGGPIGTAALAKLNLRGDYQR